MHTNPGISSGLHSLSDAANRAMSIANNLMDSTEQPAWKLYVLDPRTVSLLAISIHEWMISTGRLDADEGLLERWQATPGWIAVTSSNKGTRVEQELARETCLTAVQRITLSLWHDEVPCQWFPLETYHERQFLEFIGADIHTEHPVGVILYGEVNEAMGISE